MKDIFQILLRSKLGRPSEQSLLVCPVLTFQGFNELSITISII